MPDLITIPGLPQLWTRTQGDARIKIAVLDGSADMTRACFQGSNLTQIRPYWQEEPEPIKPAYLAQWWKIQALEKEKADLKKGEEETDAEEAALKAEIEALQETIPQPIRNRLSCDFHATHIASTIIGQHGSPAPGMAPGCTAINIPIDINGEGSEFISPLNIARAFNLAMEQGAHIVHCAACHPTQTGLAHELIARAVKQCQDSGILVVAPGGNDKGECWCVPAVLPNVLTVGALRDDGIPFKFSNWGGRYQEQGIMTFGENILGAQPGTDEPARKKGTSCAAPIITGLVALLMSIQLQRGEKPNAEAIRQAILNSAIPCNPEEVEEPERCLAGKLNIPGAFKLLTGELLTSIQPSSTTRPEINFPDNAVTPANITRPEINFRANSESPLKRNENNSISVQVSSGINVSDREEKSFVDNSINSPFQRTFAMSLGIDSQADSGTVQPSNTTIVTLTTNEPTEGITADRATDSITASAASNLVYALGTIGYDFGSEARRDSFKQLMPAVEIDGTLVPANPYDTRQMVDYLSQNPAEAKALIWTLNQELTPIYALEPRQGFSADVYETLILMLAGQIEPEDSDDFVERVSIPAKTTEQVVQLFSGQEVPVITLINTRGMYGWKTNILVDSALETVSSRSPQADEIAMRKSLSSFLNRVYYDFRNLGKFSKDRALNFSVTNAFQAASSFAEAVSRGMQLDTIEVEKSPFCRINSDCWDVILKFFDPENSRRAKKVYRFTVDVSDRLPVTLGEVRSWSVPR